MALRITNCPSPAHALLPLPIPALPHALGGEGVVSLKFVMREDDLKDPVVIKEYEEEQKYEVAACLDSLAGLRSLLMGTDPTGHSA